MRLPGKKVGHFIAETPISRYDLDIRLEVTTDAFLVFVPKTPGATMANRYDYERFSAPTLKEVKDAVLAFLRGRDTTEFVDVIEYECQNRETFHTDTKSVGFGFVWLASPRREARVADGHGSRSRFGFHRRA